MLQVIFTCPMLNVHSSKELVNYCTVLIPAFLSSFLLHAQLFVQSTVFMAAVWLPTPVSVSPAGVDPTAQVVSLPAVAVLEQSCFCVCYSFLWKCSEHKRRKTDGLSDWSYHVHCSTPRGKNSRGIKVSVGSEGYLFFSLPFSFCWWLWLRR